MIYLSFPSLPLHIGLLSIDYSYISARNVMIRFQFTMHNSRLQSYLMQHYVPFHTYVQAAVGRTWQADTETTSRTGWERTRWQGAYMLFLFFLIQLLMFSIADSFQWIIRICTSPLSLQCRIFLYFHLFYTVLQVGYSQLALLEKTLMQDRPSIYSSTSSSSSRPAPNPVSPLRSLADMQSSCLASSDCVEDVSYSGSGIGICIGEEDSSRDFLRSQVSKMSY